jgi:uncharacterized membrane protein YjdF
MTSPRARGLGELLNPFAVVALITTLAIIVLAVVARVKTYHVAPLFLVPAVWAGYALRRRLELHPAHYALLCAAIVLHMLGAFGYYQHSPLPCSFDIVVHFYFAFAATFAIHRLIARRLDFGRWGSRLAALIIIMAIGAVHEVMEYATLLLGSENAMLKKDSYPWDTNRDLTNNFMGAVLALLIISILDVRARNSQRPGGSQSTT